MKELRVAFYKRWGKHSKPYFKWQAEQISEYTGKRIADIGCGLGNFAELFSDKELYLGFDPDESVRKEIRRLEYPENFRLADTGDICLDETVNEIDVNGIDTVICINTLEHIKDDKQALINMVKAVKKDGHVCLIVPALRCLYGSLDEFDGHYRRYSKKDLLVLTDDLGVDIVLIHYMNMIGSIGWFIKSRIVKEKTYRNTNFNIIVFLLPMISLLEKCIKPLFGLSLVLVLRKT
ncbi:MAG: class I SAM-dependent methyltransferase [Candidatus Aegiribacteria sp.]|nr:class I SAM-dependent methyltransferase [Candidatus Aegiribacteria sp.]